MRSIKLIIIALAAVSLMGGCAKFKSKDKDEDWTAEQFYDKAKEALDDKKYKTAAEYYTKLEARYPFGNYSEQGQLEIAYAYYKNNEPEIALAAADRFIRLHPTHPNIDYAYYLKGLVNFAQHKDFIDEVLGSRDFSERDPKAARESFFAFSELVERYPNSRYAPDARKKVRSLLNALAQHDIHVADYYFRRGAYVAVVNRGKYVLENYPKTPSVEDALGLMIAAYRRMDMTKLADDASRVLQLNYPESKYLKNAETLGVEKKRFSLIPSFLRRKKN